MFGKFWHLMQFANSNFIPFSCVPYIVLFSARQGHFYLIVKCKQTKPTLRCIFSVQHYSIHISFTITQFKGKFHFVPLIMEIVFSGSPMFSSSYGISLHCALFGRPKVRTFVVDFDEGIHCLLKKALICFKIVIAILLLESKRRCYKDFPGFQQNWS